jgi:HD-GYP domain-containing protein (c-di-GMP phosphodiesterase class II)
MPLTLHLASQLHTLFAPRPNSRPEREVHLVQPSSLERAKRFFFRHFERIFVLLLVASLLGIHYLVEQKVEFLSFYYLATILAGFYAGRRFAVMSGVLIVALVFFFQAWVGLGDFLPGLYEGVLLTLVPWAGFLILTGYVVGGLAEQRAARLSELKNAYLATLEVLTFHIESAERHQEGHSNRVAELAAAMGKELRLTETEIENLRIAALLHEVGTVDQRLLRLLSRSITDETVTVARALRGAAQIIAEYAHYYEIVGDDWDIEALPMAMTVKVLAVADAFETLQMATPVRPAFTRWSALEEVEKGAGKTFARESVRSLRVVAGRPEVAATPPPGSRELRAS